jgi:hypothetical protein
MPPNPVIPLLSHFATPYANCRFATIEVFRDRRKANEWLGI